MKPNSYTIEADGRSYMVVNSTTARVIATDLSRKAANELCLNLLSGYYSEDRAVILYAARKQAAFHNAAGHYL